MNKQTCEDIEAVKDAVVPLLETLAAACARAPGCPALEALGLGAGWREQAHYRLHQLGIGLNRHRLAALALVQRALRRVDTIAGRDCMQAVGLGHWVAEARAVLERAIDLGVLDGTTTTMGTQGTTWRT